MARFRIPSALLLLALAGCTLIDQTTFAPDPEPGQAAAPTPTATEPVSRGAALVNIGYRTPNPAFQQPLAVAVRAAEQRRPGSDYDVVSVSTAADAAQATKDAAAVMAEMTRLGVAQTRIHLGARLDPAQAVREVRVYLR